MIAPSCRRIRHTSNERVIFPGFRWAFSRRPVQLFGGLTSPFQGSDCCHPLLQGTVDSWSAEPWLRKTCYPQAKCGVHSMLWLPNVCEHPVIFRSICKSSLISNSSQMKHVFELWRKMSCWDFRCSLIKRGNVNCLEYCMDAEPDPLVIMTIPEFALRSRPGSWTELWAASSVW